MVHIPSPYEFGFREFIMAESLNV